MNTPSALHRWPAAAGFALSLLASAAASAQTAPDTATLERVEVIGTRTPLPVARNHVPRLLERLGIADADSTVRS